MPQTLTRESNRRFLLKWFDSFAWLEYSKEKDAAFCLPCYLFKCNFDKHGKAGSDVFTEKGFKNWRKGPRILGTILDMLEVFTVKLHNIV